MKKKIEVKDDLVPRHKLDLWLKNKWNVLFKGRHGVGKTAIILSAFKRAGLRYAYFSGATMDPFIDFIGVPVKVHNPITGKDTIRIIRPEHITKLDIQALFFDEFNRTHKKIRNAVMELMQFKTINGRPLSSDLQVIWAAVNPDDDEGEYDVDKIDPAQQDRFHIQIDIPFKCSVAYFRRKHGDIGVSAVKYWNKLPKEIQDKVSPRRLDYALQLFDKGGDISDSLPVEVNISKLTSILNGKGYEDLDPYLKDPDKAEKFFADEANYATYIDDVLSSTKYNKLLDSIADEKIVSLLVKEKTGKIVKNYIQKVINKGEGSLYQPILKQVAEAAQNLSMERWCRKMMRYYKLQQQAKRIGNVRAKSQQKLWNNIARGLIPNKSAWKRSANGTMVPKGANVSNAVNGNMSTKMALVQIFKSMKTSRVKFPDKVIKADLQKLTGHNRAESTIHNKIVLLAQWFSIKHGLSIMYHNGLWSVK